jgi:hypothetical protein
MRPSHRSLTMVLVAGVVLLLGACNDALDHGDSPNVVLSVYQFPAIPAVTATWNAELGGCVLTLPEALSVSLLNQPKNSLAQSPFSDVVIESATVSYHWDDGVSTGQYLESNAGTIPVGGKNSVPLWPILISTLTADRVGHWGNVYVTFHGKTIDNRKIDSLPAPPGGGVIQVEDCVPSSGK